MRSLLGDAKLARELGEAGRKTASERFAISRFVDDWLRLLAEMTL
jgi:hypothetical protein